MPRDVWKRVYLREGERLHVETPLGIVNIHTGLHDRLDRRVEAVEMIPNDYSGWPRVKVIGSRLVELKGVTT